MSGMPKSSFFIWCCPNPINFDTYDGCAHKCSYCFTNFRSPNAAGKFKDIKRGSTADSLRKWVEGGRGAREKWCEGWRIPICWGRSSDPFQPMERETGWSLECLKVLAESQYPFIVTTKSTLIAEEPYISLFAKCNCVIQISMVCSAYDRFEKGAPKYEERLECAKKMVAAGCKRVIARWQPMFFEPWTEHAAEREIPRLKAAGVYGVLCESAKLPKPMGRCSCRAGHGKLYTYRKRDDVGYLKIKNECHKNGLVFLCGDRQYMSDSLECCGTEGLGWEPNLCTVTRYYLDRPSYAVRDCQKVAGTGCAFKNCHCQSLADTSFMQKSFEENIRDYFGEDFESVVTTGMPIAIRKEAGLLRKGGDRHDDQGHQARQG